MLACERRRIQIIKEILNITIRKRELSNKEHVYFFDLLYEKSTLVLMEILNILKKKNENENKEPNKN